MTDLISRQAALDAFKVCVTIGRGNGKSVAFKNANDYADIVRKRIEALPSVQPEITLCKDCSWYIKADCLCPHGVFMPSDDDYCSWALRRREDG